MDRSTKVTLIAVLWILILQYSFGFIPNALGSWSAGIDLQRYTIQTTGRLGPVFLNGQQSGWFEQASADPVYGVFYAFDAILAGAGSLSSSLRLLTLMPPSLLLVAFGALASTRELSRLLVRSRSVGFLPLLPVLFILPVGRLHVLLLGTSGSALASGLLMLILWLLMKLAAAPKTDLRLVAIVLTLMYVLTNTYHTWSTYFAILGLVALALRTLGKVTRPFRNRSLTLLIYAPLFWLFTAFYAGSGILFSRFVEALVAVRTLAPFENVIGPYFGSEGPLQPYLRVVPLWTPNRISNLVALALFAIAFSVAILTLATNRRERQSSAVIEYGLVVSFGSLLTVPALFALGGLNLAFSRGVEFLSVTGPFAIGSALVSNAQRPNRSSPDDPPTRHIRFQPRASESLPLLLLAFVVSNVVALSIAFPQTPHDEVLSAAEAQAVKSLGNFLDRQTVVWSDDRIASAFLYYEPRAFVSLDLAYNSSTAAAATISVFYGQNCKQVESSVTGTGADVAILTQYMETGGIVQRDAFLNPSETVFSCFDQFAPRFYDDGEAVGYSLYPDSLVASP